MKNALGLVAFLVFGWGLFGVAFKFVVWVALEAVLTVGA